jgi:hypothetical protein
LKPFSITIISIFAVKKINVMKTLIIHTEDDKIQIIKDFLNSIKVKFETKSISNDEENTYDSEFVTKIERSRQQLKEGKTTRVKIEDLWK